MRKIFLVRHPEIEDHASRRFYGRKDVGLSQRGKIQAHELALRLAQEKIYLVYSSDLYRARYAASLLADRLDIRHIGLADLNEIHFGDWEGLTFEEIEKSAPDSCQRWLTHTCAFRFPGGESVEEFRCRVRKGYDFILDSSSPAQGDVAVITHGGAIRVILCGILGLDIGRMWEIHPDFGAITTVQYPNDDPESPQLAAINDLSYQRNSRSLNLS